LSCFYCCDICNEKQLEEANCQGSSAFEYFVVLFGYFVSFLWGKIIWEQIQLLIGWEELGAFQVKTLGAN